VTPVVGGLTEGGRGDTLQLRSEFRAKAAGMAMSTDLSPQNEQFIEDAGARGSYPSRAAALNAAVESLKYRQAELIEEINAGIDEAGQGQIDSLDIEDIKRLGRMRLADEGPH
jgi:Arc/MetJ-type ribon-helix-helix transcriptional regulator